MQLIQSKCSCYDAVECGVRDSIGISLMSACLKLHSAINAGPLWMKPKHFDIYEHLPGFDAAYPT